MDSKEKTQVGNPTHGGHTAILSQYDGIEDPAVKKIISDSIAQSTVNDRQKVYHEKIREKVFGEVIPNAPFAIDRSRLENKQSFEIHEEVATQSFAEITRLKEEVASQASQLTDKYTFDEEGKRVQKALESNVASLKEELAVKTNESESALNKTQNVIRGEWNTQNILNSYSDVIRKNFPQYSADDKLAFGLQSYAPTLVNVILSRFDIIPEKVSSEFHVDKLEYSFIERGEQNPLNDVYYADFDENGVNERRPVRNFEDLITSILPERLQSMRYEEKTEGGAGGQPAGQGGNTANNSGYPQFKTQESMNEWLNANVDTKNTIKRKDAKKTILNYHLNTIGTSMP